jgi:hypothetical protein
MEARPELLGTVELRERAAVSPRARSASSCRRRLLVEIADEHGRTVELLTVPYEALRIRESEPARRGAAG